MLLGLDKDYFKYKRAQKYHLIEKLGIHLIKSKIIHNLQLREAAKRELINKLREKVKVQPENSFDEWDEILPKEEEEKEQEIEIPMKYNATIDLKDAWKYLTNI